MVPVDNSGSNFLRDSVVLRVMLNFSTFRQFPLLYLPLLTFGLRVTLLTFSIWPSLIGVFSLSFFLSFPFSWLAHSSCAVRRLYPSVTVPLLGFFLINLSDRVKKKKKKKKKKNLTHVDFETAFMVPEMDVEVYIKVTEGMGALAPNGVAKMLKGIKWCQTRLKTFSWRSYKRALFKVGFKMSLFDSCVFFKGEGQGVCIVIVWVDDLLIAYGEGANNTGIIASSSSTSTSLLSIQPWFLGVKLHRVERLHGQLHAHVRSAKKNVKVEKD